MSRIKKAFIFSLSLLPFAILGGYFVTLYQIDMYDQTTMDAIISQAGSVSNLVMISVIQTVLYACILGFFGYLLSDRIGLMKPLHLEKNACIRTVGWSVVFGILFSLDYWTFGKWIPKLDVSNTTATALTINGWLGSILYGGVIEEIIMRLFFMSLLAWIGWKVFFRKKGTPPAGVILVANVLAALLFAAGHLPATIAFFGELTPLLLFRCFLLNGSFGIFFGWLYRKYGIQYAIIGHAMLHIVSKTVWVLFL